MAERREPRHRRAGNELTEVWRVELMRGLRCLADGNMDGAEGHFQRAYQCGRGRPEVCFALGRERLRQGRLSEAEALLRDAWSGNGMLAAAAALARCLGEVPGRRDEAHAVLDEACATEAEEPGLLVVRAELFLDEGQAGRARAALDRARGILEGEDREAPATRAALASAEARVLNLEGIALGRDGRHEEALFAFKRAFDLDPTAAGPLVNMGAVFARLGRHARARACYERALVLDPDNAVARFNLAELAAHRGDAETAELEYRHVLDLAAAYPGARVALADLLVSRGRTGEAIDVVRGGKLILEPDQVPLCCSLAVRVLAAGHTSEASLLIQAARAVDAVQAAALLASD